MNIPVGLAIFIAVAFLFGLYEIGYGFYAWRKRVASRKHPLEGEKWEAILDGRGS
jgi:hypothetical protein